MNRNKFKIVVAYMLGNITKCYVTVIPNGNR